VWHPEDLSSGWCRWYNGHAGTMGASKCCIQQCNGDAMTVQWCSSGVARMVQWWCNNGAMLEPSWETTPLQYQLLAHCCRGATFPTFWASHVVLTYSAIALHS
jgi:hypothetical protein